jgi:glycosyltransferase involved in cell wall biosynthesis
MEPAETPFLSAIIISQNNGATIACTVASVVTQDCPKPFEVILVDSGADETPETIKSRFPGVVVLSLHHPVLPGKARNEGLKIARGEYVSFPGSHVELLPGSLAARMTAHEKGYAMVTGAILNGTDTPAGWASYFIDHSFSLPGRPSGPSNVAPNSCSYDRRVLIQSGLFPEDWRAGEDTIVNQRLWEAGHRAYRDNTIKLVHITRCKTPWGMASHHFNRGRAWGRILGERGSNLGHLAEYVSRRLKVIDDCVRQWGEELEDHYCRVKPLIRVGVTSAWLGANFELAIWRLRPNRPAKSVAFTTPFSTSNSDDQEG